MGLLALDMRAIDIMCLLFLSKIYDWFCILVNFEIFFDGIFLAFHFICNARKKSHVTVHRNECMPFVFNGNAHWNDAKKTVTVTFDLVKFYEAVYSNMLAEENENDNHNRTPKAE